jgi:hypothetical protein
MAAQVHDLDTVGIQTLVVDQPFRQDERLRRTARLYLDLALEALETMTVGIQEVLVEGDTIGVHVALHPLRCRR